MIGWTDVAPLNHIRSHPATCVWQGKVYVFGGGGVRFASLNTVECYDPQADRWDLLTPMPTLRSGAHAAVVNGKIYVVGGGFCQDNGKFRFLPTVEIYDPATDSWSDGPDMGQPHDYPALAELDGTIYTIAGHHPDATEGGPSTDPAFSYSEKLAPGAAAWEQIADLPIPRFAPMGLTWQGKVWAIGGCRYVEEVDGVRDFDRIDIFDPATGTWSMPDFTMPWPAAAHGVSRRGEWVYVVGGYSGPAIHDRTVRFNADNGASEDLPSLNEPRAAMGLEIIGNHLLAIGGWKGDGRSVTDRVERLDLPADPGSL
ncbi:MAG: Kelch repeat-containing protein [Leptospirillia bacterium]